MRLGLAGAGRMGTFHAGTLRGLPGVDSVVVADANCAVAKALSERLGIGYLERPDDLFTAGIDGLVVAAATDAHAALIVAGVEAGIPVFCEKPATTDAAGTRALIAGVAGSKVPVYIGFQRRFDAGFVAARNAVLSGRLGWVHTVRACTLDPAPPPVAYIVASAGFFRDCSVHDFDAIRWITGQEVVEVYARGAVRGDDFFREAGDVDTVAALLELSDGTFAHVSASRYNAHGYDVRLEVLGSQRSISVGLDDRMPVESVEAGISFPAGQPHSNFIERFGAAYVAELAAFADVVAGAGNVQPMCSLSDALEATLIAEACELSRLAHRPVRMEEVRA